MKVGLEIKTLMKIKLKMISWLVVCDVSFQSYLNVLALLSSRRQGESLEGDWTLEANFDGRMLDTIIVSTLRGCE